MQNFITSWIYVLLTCQYIRRNSWRSVQHCLNRKQGLTDICYCRSPRLTHTRAGTFWMIGTLFEVFTILLWRNHAVVISRPKTRGGHRGTCSLFYPWRGWAHFLRQNRRKEKKWIEGKEKWKKEGKKGNKLAA